ncbi:MAG: hypothetical protein ACXAC7_08585 [Candidatus Hodarchaeales archaeon]|jgi:hypothetical protein
MAQPVIRKDYTKTTKNFRKLPKFSLNKLPGFNKILIQFQLIEFIKYVSFISMIFIIISGLFGTNIGLLNPAIFLVWIGWWLALTIIFFPFNAKTWCSVCPIPLGGQLIHRYAPLNWLRNKKFPKRLKLFGFLPLILFLIFSTLSVPISTIPFYTGIILLIMIITATIVDGIGEERSFCKNICPINSMLKVYGNTGVLQVQPIDYSVCLEEHVRTCMLGEESSGWGCDWGFFPGKLKTNLNNCTTCLECFKSCSRDNLTLQLSKPKILPMEKEKLSFSDGVAPIFFFGIIVIYTILKIGTIKPLHNWMLIVTLTDAIFYFFVEFFLIMILIPSIFFVFIVFPILYGMYKENTPKKEIRDNVIKSSLSTIPLSLSAWIAFSITFILPSIPLMIRWFADPLQMGWNPFGLKTIQHLPGELLQLIMLIAGFILSIGFILSLKTGSEFLASLKLSKKHQSLPFIGQFIFYSLFFILILNPKILRDCHQILLYNFPHRNK